METKYILSAIIGTLRKIGHGDKFISTLEGVDFILLGATIFGIFFVDDINVRNNIVRVCVSLTLVVAVITVVVMLACTEWSNNND